MAAATTVVLAHQGGWDEMLFVLVPLLVFFILQWLNRRKAREQSDKGDGPSAQ
jgi:cyanate permease